MPEIKAKHKSQPVLNTAQQQMQRSFVRAKQEQAAHRQSEQSESPSNYAEEKVSRTAEDAVWEQGHYCSMKFALFATVTAPRNPQCLRKTPIGRKSHGRFFKIIGKYAAELRKMLPPSAHGSM